MVVVMQFLTADQNAPGNDIGTGVGGLEVAVAPVVTDAVDDAGSQERDPQHLHGKHGDTDRAEQDHVGDQHDGNAPAVMAVNIALEPVIGRTVTVAIQCFLVAAFLAVQFGALQQNLADAVNLRAVRIINRFAFGVMFAVDGCPVFGQHAGGQPKPETEEMRRDRMQIQRTVCGVTMQVNRNACNRDVGKDEGISDIAPPR